MSLDDGQKGGSLKIKNFNAKEFFEVTNRYPQIRDMKVAQFGFVTPRALILTEQGDLYLNKAFVIDDLNASAKVQITRISTEADGYHIDTQFLKSKQLLDIIRVKSIEDYLWHYYVDHKENVVKILNMRPIFTPLKSELRNNSEDLDSIKDPTAPK